MLDRSRKRRRKLKYERTKGEDFNIYLCKGRV